MAGTIVDPTNTATSNPGGKPPRQDSETAILRDLINRVTALEAAQTRNQGITFLSPNGQKSETLSLSNLGSFIAPNVAWTRFSSGYYYAPWTDYGGSGWQYAGFGVGLDGRVFVRGLIHNTVASAYPGTNVIIATGLPVPSSETSVMGVGMFSDSAGHFGLARVDIYNGAGGTTPGQMQLGGQDFANTGGNNGSYAWMALLIPPYTTV